MKEDKNIGIMTTLKKTYPRKGPPSSPYKVLRGGCWSSHRGKLRAAYRNYDLATDRHLEVGFRCVR